MIKTGRYGIAPGSPLVIGIGEPASSAAIRIAPPPAELSATPEATRAEDLASHLDFLWRFACRMGIGSAAAEDIAHEAYVIALSRIDAIVPGKERSYLLSVVVNMVRRERQRGARHDDLTIEPAAPQGDAPDHALDEKRARELLDRSLDALDDDLRAVFVLHEIEEETMATIGQLLDLAPGTVASRARRMEARDRASQARSEAAVSEQQYDDFDRALLRSGRNAEAPTARMRARALRAAATAGVATGAALTATKLATATKAGFFAKALELAVAFKWVVAATVATASVGTAVYVHEVADAERTLAPAATTTAASTAVVAPTSAPPTSARAAPIAPSAVDVTEEPPAPPVEVARPAPRVVATVRTSPSVSPAATAAPVIATNAATPAAQVTSTVGAELAILDAARQAIARGDAAQARRLTDEHAQRFPSGALAVERDALRARIAKMAVSNP